jgi:peroxiredoxin
MRATAPRLGVGERAPQFALPSIQGAVIDLAAYRGQLNVIVWFSRGFTCPFCLMYMDGIRAGYEALAGTGTEVIQIAPNLLEAARNFFAGSAAPFPFVCDPDKRLYAIYGLGDRGALDASRTAVVSFSRALAQGDGGTWTRGAWLDVVNRNFVRRLHHHAMTAIEQGVFLVDREGVIRYISIVGPIDPVPDGAQLTALVSEHCGAQAQRT